MSLTALLGTIGAGLVGVIGVWLHGKSRGKNSQINKQNKQVLDNVKKSKEAQDASNSMSIDEQLKQLRDNDYSSK